MLNYGEEPRGGMHAVKISCSCGGRVLENVLERNFIIWGEEGAAWG